MEHIVSVLHMTCVLSIWTDADSCSAGNRKFLVGEVINNNCEDRCECLRTGDLHCEPACQQYQEQVAGDSTSECRNVTTNDGCCTYTECSTESTLPVTVPAEETSSQYQVRIKILNISMTSVILEILFYGTPHVQHLKLCIKNTRHLNSTKESETQYKQRYYRIEGLKPGQEYAIWILFELFNNEQVKSDEKVFQTILKKENQTVYHKRSHDQDKQNNQISSHSSVYIGVIVGIVVAMTALITVWILFMLKSRKQQKRETLSFVNFTFGVDISSVSQTDGNKDNNVNI